MIRVLSVLLLFLCFAAPRVNAQDLIVSNEGDSLNCTVKVKNLKSIHFFYKEDNEVITRELPADLFKTVIIGFYKNKKQPEVSPSPKTEAAAVSRDSTAPAVIPNAVLIAENKEVSATTDERIVAKDTLAIKTEGIVDEIPKKSVAPENVNLVAHDETQSEPGRLHVTFRAGYANRLFRTGTDASADQAKYLKRLKSGYAVGAGAGYFFWEKVGLGINGEIYKSVARMEDDSRNDAISIKFIGPSVLHRKFLRNPKNVVSSAFSVGYQTFSNRGQEAGTQFRLNGHSLGWGASTGIDLSISPQAALSFTASCLIGTVYRMTTQSGGQTSTVKLPKDKFEELSRFSLTVGLKFM